MTNEIWKDIEGYEGLYQVSNLGTVKSLPKIIVRYNWRNQTLKEKIRKPVVNSRGYYSVGLWKEGKNNTFRINRLVACAFLTNAGNKKEVNHINGIKSDNRLENLEWVTSRENKIHAKLNGLTNIGESAVSSKLTEDNVIEIVNKLINGSRNRDLALEYNISSQNISSIKRGKSWAHINCPKLQKGYGNAILTSKQVLEIKGKLSKGARGVDLASEYSVSNCIISLIKRGKTWKHVGTL